MRAAFFTLGCKVNQYETLVLQQQFAASGFDVVDHGQDADVYVVNSCTVTAAGDQKSRRMLRRFRRQNPAAVLCLCGCFPQAFPAIADSLPEADIVTGASCKNKLLDMVKARMAGGPRVVDIHPHQRGEGFEKMKLTASSARTRAFVKIQDGCERYCAYCIIPKARGPVRSKAMADLKEELQSLAQSGFQEVVLAGINLSAFGQDTGHRLLDAVAMACETDGIHRVRLGSLEPELLTSEDISSLARLPGFCPQFHLSLQSGCDATLKRMRRHYDTAEYRRIVRDLRSAFPNCAITTDIMVGFPGETDEEFAQSLAFVREISFARAHVFAYSVRPGTAAASMAGQVTEKVKSNRSRLMLEEAAAGRRDFLARQQGCVARVLFETQTVDGWEGYSENYTTVRVCSLDNLSNTIREVEITGAGEDYCLGFMAVD